jgi:hypothetical protein
MRHKVCLRDISFSLPLPTTPSSAAEEDASAERGLSGESTVGLHPAPRARMSESPWHARAHERA